jgi:hypothetical protein
MFDSVSVPKLFTTEDFLSNQNVMLVDETVAEVFGMMLGFAAQPVDSGRADRGAVGGDARLVRGADDRWGCAFDYVGDAWRGGCCRGGSVDRRCDWRGVQYDRGRMEEQDSDAFVEVLTLSSDGGFRQ